MRIVTFVSERDGAIACIEMPMPTKAEKGGSPVRLGWNPVVVHAPTEDEARAKAQVFYDSEMERLSAKARNKLEGAAVLVERGWTQGAFARNAAGKQVDMWSNEATCFCVSAALQKVDGRVRSDAWNRFDAYTRKRGFRHMADFNDAPGRTQAEVAQALRQCARQSNGDQE